jgi:hypothetical protein
MKLSDLQDVIALLSAATLADPLLTLCSSLAWLDPLVIQADTFMDEFEYPYADTSDPWMSIALGWDISRRCFPAVYANTTLALRSGTPEPQISDLLCEGINQHLVGGEIHDLEQLHFGLPFFGMGADVTSPEFFAEPAHAPLVQVYKLFGVTVGDYSIPDNFDQAARVAQVLALSLREIGIVPHTNVAWLLEWLFAQTGNTAADYTDDDFFEMGLEPLPWEPHEVEFNTLMHSEAAEIVQFAYQGLDKLLSDPDLQTALRTNIETVVRSVRKVKRHDFNTAYAHRLAQRLRWADGPKPVDAGGANLNPESLSLRCAAAA